MTTQKKITVDGIDYVRADTIPAHAPADSPVRIVVLQRGWVVVGYYSEDGDRVTVSNASVIRRWGTTKGLGELVTGPTSETVLDPVGLVEAHRLGVLFTVACSDESWAGLL